MIFLLFLLKMVIPLSGGRMYALMMIVLYAGLGGFIYLLITAKLKIFEGIFGCTMKEFIVRKGGK